MNDLHNWEEFALGPKTKREELHATINGKGEIMLGARISRMFGKYRKAVLLWDKWNRVIGIAPAIDETPNAFPLVDKKNGQHRVIRAGRFFRYYNLKVERTTAVHADVDRNGTLTLDLNLTRNVSRAVNPDREPVEKLKY